MRRHVGEPRLTGGRPTEYPVSCPHLKMIQTARSCPCANHLVTQRPHRAGGGGDGRSGRAGPTLSPSHSLWSCGPAQWWTSPPCTSGSIQMHVPETAITSVKNIWSETCKQHLYKMAAYAILHYCKPFWLRMKLSLNTDECQTADPIQFDNFSPSN